MLHTLGTLHTLHTLGTLQTLYVQRTLHKLHIQEELLGKKPKVTTLLKRTPLSEAAGNTKQMVPREALCTLVKQMFDEVLQER